MPDKTTDHAETATVSEDTSRNGEQPTAKKRGKARRSKKRSKKTLTKKTSRASSRDGSRRRGPKPYPVITFEEAMTIGTGVMEHGAGHPMKRVTLLQKLKLADSQPTRNLITNSGKYGITIGSHAAEEIKLTERGREAIDPGITERKRRRAQFDLAIASIDQFKSLYDKFSGGKLPAAEVLRDSLEDVDSGDRAQCVDIFISNAKTVGILQTKEGAEHLLKIDEFLDGLPGKGSSPTQRTGEQRDDDESTGDMAEEDFDQVCFFIAPIGDEGTEQRKHSDAIRASFIEPAMQEHDLKVVRADQITRPGMISQHIIEYILKSRLVVADLSFHNPNVFYELCLRHVTGKPTVHLIREEDPIPFDVGNFRTVRIKIDCPYGILARQDTYRSEIAQQIRQVLTDGVSTNNPILAYVPGAEFTVNGNSI